MSIYVQRRIMDFFESLSRAFHVKNLQFVDDFLSSDVPHRVTSEGMRFLFDRLLTLYEPIFLGKAYTIPKERKLFLLQVCKKLFGDDNWRWGVVSGHTRKMEFMEYFLEHDKHHIIFELYKCGLHFDMNLTAESLLLFECAGLKWPKDAAEKRVCLHRMFLAYNGNNCSTNYKIVCRAAYSSQHPVACFCNCFTSRLQLVFDAFNATPEMRKFDSRLLDEWRLIQKAGVSQIVKRATGICVGLQELSLDAVCLSEIVIAACQPVTNQLDYHCIWEIVVRVKHWRDRRARQT